MIMVKKALTWVLVLSFFTTLSCSSKDNKGRVVSITALRPPVEAAAGTGLTAESTRGLRTAGLDLANFQSRFFTEGPTSVLSILSSIDARLVEIATRALAGEDAGACLDNDPTAVDIAVLGTTLTMQLQCYDEVSGGGLLAFGYKDSKWYVYQKIGASVTAAIAESLADSKVSVEVYGGVGLTNVPDWSSMSYGVYHLKANSLTDAIEMTAAGHGFGYCGVQLKSDATNIYVNGSEADPGCGATDSNCVLKSDLVTTGTCTDIDDNDFELASLGRQAFTDAAAVSKAASTFPSTAKIVTLTGAAGDSVHFGPTVASDLPSTVTAF